MLRFKATSFFKLIVIKWSSSCCLSKGLKEKKRQFEAGERRISQQLDVVHFIKNAVMIETLSKLSLSKCERYLILRQPKVHLLNKTSSPASDSDNEIGTDK